MPLKTLNEINQNYKDELKDSAFKQQSAQESRKSVLQIFSDILFYLAVLVILYSVLSIDLSDGSPRSVMGFSGFVVMSSSMKDEIPKGSFIVVRRTDPNALKKGDNITFSNNGNGTVTHKIIEIFGDDEDSGDAQSNSQRSFQTKGVNNANPDYFIVEASDVLGKVVLVVPGVGSLIGSIGENIHIVLIVFLLVSMVSFIFRPVAKKVNRNK